MRRRQLGKGDIVLHQSDLGGSTVQGAPLDNPDRMLPSGMVEYKFYDTFPFANRKTVWRAMDCITRKVLCITFREATELTVVMLRYVL